jgi:murein DD-endopeptidase MepM/ murein hydrolase activator NlpD
MGRTFAAPATPYAAGHRGVDLVVAAGSEVRSPADGVVTFAGVVVDRSVVTLDVGDDLLVSFEPLEAAVVKGAPVARGALIGHASEGGHCGTECLHVGVRLRGEYISPLLFFDRVPRAVLLPLK